MKCPIVIQLIVCVGLQYTTAIVKLDCGNPTLTAYCPNDVQYITCEVTKTINVSMQWESSAFTVMEFFGSPVGYTIQRNLFTAIIANATSDKRAISVLSYPNNKQLDEICVTCRDFYDGHYRSCIIHVNYPTSPHSPMNLTSVQLSIDTVKLLWNMASNDVTSINTSYNVTVWITNNTAVSWITNNTELVLDELQPNLKYFWFVEVNTCMDKHRSVTKTFELIIQAPSPVENLAVCVYYQSLNATYFANISWENSYVNYQFQSSITQYMLYTAYYQGDLIIDVDILQPAKTTLQYKQVVLSQYSSYNFTVSAISSIGESEYNPSMTKDTNESSVNVNILLIGESYIAMLITLDNFIECAAVPVMYRIVLSYYQQYGSSDELQQENKVINDQFFYHVDFDKEGRSIILQNLHSNSTYVYSVFVYDINGLKIKPQLGTFITNTTDALTESKGKSQHIQNSGVIPINCNKTTVNYTPSLAIWESSGSITSSYYTNTNSVLPSTHIKEYPDQYSWVLLLLAALISVTVVLVLILCFMSCLLLSMKKTIVLQRRALKNRRNASGPVSCRNNLVMNDNDAYAFIQNSTNISDSQNKAIFRDRYLT